MKIFSIIIILLFLFSPTLYSEDYPECESECSPPNSCATLIECRVMKIQCTDSCRQRKAWEQLAQSVEKFTLTLAKKVARFSEDLEVLKKDVSEQNIAITSQMNEMNRKLNLIHKQLLVEVPESPVQEETE
jgi:hypothetical protein